MPLLADDPTAPTPRVPLGVDPPAPKQVDPDALAAAAFRTGSPIGAAVAAGPYIPAGDPSYNPIEDIKGTFYSRDWGDRFVGSRSPEETADIRGRIDRELADKQMVASAGIAGTVLSAGAGLIDPTLLLPYGVIARGVRGGVSVGRSAALAAGSGLLQGTASAALMSGAQETYTAEEAAHTIAAATLLNGIIGVGAASLLSGAERRVAQRALQADREFLAGQAPAAAARDLRMEAPSAAHPPEWHADASWKTEPLRPAPAEIRAVLPEGDVQVAPTTGRLVQVDAATGERMPLVLSNHADDVAQAGERAAGLDDRIPFAVRTADDAAAAVAHIEPRVAALEAAARVPGELPRYGSGDAPANSNAPGLAQSAGAAVGDTRSSRLVGYGIDRIPGVNRLFTRADPVNRLFASPLTSARRALADLAVVALQTVDNTAVGGFRATARGGIGPAEGEIKLARQQLGVAHDMVLDDAWKRYRFGSVDSAPVLAKERAAWEARTSPEGSGRKLSFSEFDEAVGQAMMAGDQHPIPEVVEAAKWTREHVFTPWFERAKATDYYSTLRDHESAPDYFHRVFNTEFMKAHSSDFVRDIANWYEGEQARQFALQQQLDYLDAARRSIQTDAGKLRARLETVENRLKDLASRTAERGMETNRTAKRAGAVEDRLGDQAAEISELAEFAATLRRQATDPASRAEIEQLQANVHDLGIAERQARMSPAALDRLEEQELRDRFLASDDDKTVADLVIGRRKAPKDPNFVSFLVENGGVNDLGGEVRAMVGAGRARPGLINKNGRSIDAWGEQLMDRFPEVFPERPSAIEVERIIDEAVRGGRSPHWFADAVLSPAESRLYRLSEASGNLREEMRRLGYDPSTRLDVARFERDMRGPDIAGPERFDETPGAPPSVGLEDAQAALGRARDKLQETRDLVATARTRSARLEGAASRNRVRAQEAGSAADANASRMDTLAERTAIAERKRDLLNDMIGVSDRMEAKATKDIEERVRQWAGNSAAEAVSALKSREKLEAKRAADAAASGRPLPTTRLGSADDAVDRVLRRILGTDRQKSRLEMEERARETFDRIISSPDGRLPYADASAQIEPGPGSNPTRGALHSRNFNAPNDVLAPYLERSSERVVKKYLRQTVPDVVLAERFGDPAMSDVLRKVQDEAQAVVGQRRSDGGAVLSPEEQARVFAERDENIRDISAIRDRINGTFVLQGAAKTRNAARIGAAVRSYNGIVDLGTSTLNSMGDVAGSVFRWGFGTVLGEGYAPWIKGLVGAGDGFRQAKAQYRTMGIAVETALATRASALDELSEMWRPTSRLERGLQAAGEKFQVLNLQAPWTDFTKTVASIVSGNEILRAAEAARRGTATEKQLADLAASNIEAHMAVRIREQFDQAGGRVVDGVHLPDTEKWTDREARLAFEQAVAREADIAVVTPGQEKPLWLSRPLTGLFGQHKSFVFASTQRIMQANLQRADANTLAGLVTAISAGQMSALLYAVAADRPLPGTPSEWMKEGISRSGVMGWLDDANTIAAKATRGQADIYRLIGADKPLSKFSALSITDMLAGPTAGKLQALQGVLGAPLSEEGWTARDTEKARRLLPLQNLFYIRRLLNEVEDATNRGLGISPIERGLEPKVAE